MWFIPPIPLGSHIPGIPSPAGGNLLCPSTGVTQPRILGTGDLPSAPSQEFPHYCEQQETRQMQWEPRPQGSAMQGSALPGRTGPGGAARAGSVLSGWAGMLVLIPGRTNSLNAVPGGSS